MSLDMATQVTHKRGPLQNPEAAVLPSRLGWIHRLFDQLFLDMLDGRRNNYRSGRIEEPRCIEKATPRPGGGYWGRLGNRAGCVRHGLDGVKTLHLAGAIAVPPRKRGHRCSRLVYPTCRLFRRFKPAFCKPGISEFIGSSTSLSRHAYTSDIHPGLNKFVRVGRGFCVVCSSCRATF